MFAGRQDSCVALRSEDVGVLDGFLWLRLSEKGRKNTVTRRVIRIPTSPRQVRGVWSVIPRVASLLLAYIEVRTAHSEGVVPDFFFQLPSERARPTTTTMGGWLATALQRSGISAPAGFAYLGHSLRSGGVSTMACMGISRPVYVWVGGWARGSSVVDRDYLDPTMLPSPDAYSIFGWLLEREFAVGPGVAAERSRLPDPLDM